MMEKTKLREFYIGTFPDDRIGIEIDPNATFYDLFLTLDQYGDVYECIGIADSVVRQRMFAKLAEIMGVGYGEIYEQWMRAA